jgi:two-component system, OmpR family, sensor kinase ParS
VGKLFLKLWVLILLTSVTSFMIQRTVFDWTSAEADTSYRDERWRRTFVFVEEALRPYPQSEWRARFDTLAKRAGAPYRLLTVNELANTGEIDAGTIELIRASEIHVHKLEPDTGMVLYRALLDSDYVAALQVASPPAPKVFGIFKPVVFTWLVECTLYALAILLWLRLFWRDLKQLMAGAEKIGKGEFKQSVALRRSSVLRPLGESFDRMSSRIQALVLSHKDLTSAVSHELKTPLARLRFAISLVPEAGSPLERERLLQKMQHDVDELDGLVREMLLYSKLELDTPAIELKRVPIESWLPRAVDDEVQAAEANDIRIPVAVSAEMFDVPCEPKYMARAVQNLVRNALRFANSRVEVKVTQRENGVRIHVDDDGPGIPIAERGRLFVPFSRLDQSRNRDSGGTGLGLAIVQRIAQWHGGVASISDSPLGGTRISIDWPEFRALPVALPATPAAAAST